MLDLFEDYFERALSCFLYLSVPRISGFFLMNMRIVELHVVEKVTSAHAPWYTEAAMLSF
jgi:hypothetical protein